MTGVTPDLLTALFVTFIQQMLGAELSGRGAAKRQAAAGPHARRRRPFVVHEGAMFEGCNALYARAATTQA